MVQKIVAILLIIGATVIADLYVQSIDNICVFNEHCNADACCIMNLSTLKRRGEFEGYCGLKPKEGESCLLDNKMLDGKIFKIDDTRSAQLAEVYEHACPCQDNLKCIANSGTNGATCQKNSTTAN